MTIAVVIIALAAGTLTWAILAAERREKRKQTSDRTFSANKKD